MAKLGQFTNPVSGQKGSVFNIGELGSMVTGTMVLLGTVAAGTWLFNMVKGVAPGPFRGALDTRNVLTPRTGPTVQTSAGPTVTLYK